MQSLEKKCYFSRLNEVDLDLMALSFSSRKSCYVYQCLQKIWSHRFFFLQKLKILVMSTSCIFFPRKEYSVLQERMITARKRRKEGRKEGTKERRKEGRKEREKMYLDLCIIRCRNKSVKCRRAVIKRSIGCTGSAIQPRLISQLHIMHLLMTDSTQILWAWSLA